MATSSPNPPVMPRQDVPFIDPETGRINPAWYLWLAAWEKIWRIVRSEIP
jgi:hypothetical protein